MLRPAPRHPHLALIVALLTAGCVFGTDDGAPAAEPDTAASQVLVGEPGGEVLATPAESSTPSPPAEPVASQTAAPTSAATTVGAEILACASISGPACEGQLTRLDGVDRFVALVRFEAARAGDTVEAVLEGPSGSVRSGAYTLEGGGRGYYYAELTLPELSSGSYTLTALWNGAPAAETTLTKG